ncbi:septum site-determining protein Ssd [Actinokineospora inagensis]|uniref:septum site-determining protein Ssd n=1 Tax=Actinokineospora inagensis TaxID=103730 RepID=UPI000405111B|nr:septum site-determining protein Ssd [Actinokineospora inagensis]
MTRPTALLHDDALLDQTRRLAAAAGTELDEGTDQSTLRAAWHRAPLVLLDRVAADSCAGAALPRRPGVLLVAAGTPPACLWQLAVAIGAERVVSLPADETWLAGAFADATEAPARAVGRVLAVIGGRGGAGASVFAAAVALSALDSRANALLVDCDPTGGGLDLLLGAETDPGLRWPDLHLRAGRVPITSLHASLPGRSKGTARLTLLSATPDAPTPSPTAALSVVDSGRRAGETVICDLPRTPDPTATAVLAHADLTVVIVPADLRATAAARNLIASLTAQGITPALVVRDPTHLRPTDIAAALSLSLLTTYRHDPRLPTRIDEGTFRPRRSLARAAKTVLHALEKT